MCFSERQVLTRQELEHFILNIDMRRVVSAELARVEEVRAAET